MNTINDAMFGIMKYVHSWEKTEKHTLFGRDIELRTVAEAYENRIS